MGVDEPWGAGPSEREDAGPPLLDDDIVVHGR